MKTENSVVSLTVIIPAGNEEENIGRSVNSVIGWCDDVVVIASGEDKTEQIAKKMGARVVKKAVPGGESVFVAIQSWINEEAERAQTRWIMRLDADEVVTDKLKSELVGLIAKNETEAFDCYTIRRDQFFWGGFLKGGDWYYDRLVRLWKKGRALYDCTQAVHEKVVVKGSTGTLNERLSHFSHPTLGVYLSKINRYTDLEAQTTRLKRSTALLKMLTVPTYVWLRWYFYHHGYRDGWRGVVAATLRGYYDFLLFAKAAERVT